MWIVLLVVVIAVLALLLLPQLKGRRTQVAAWASGLIGGVVPLLSDWTGLLKEFDWQSYVGPYWAPLIILGLSLLFYVLRLVTTGPVGAK